ncbi:MAG: TolC family protein [Pseudomonadota bacterium]
MSDYLKALARPHRWFLLALMLPLAGVRAEQEAPEPLPDPLTLEHALSLVDEMHPQLLAQQALQDRARAQAQQAESQMGLSVTLEGRARWVQPSDVATDQDVTDDHKLSLFVRKPLYDFGLSDARLEAARQSGLSTEQHYEMLLRERKVAIMQAYFDVLLADMQVDRDNEELAITYINLDKLQNRQEMGQASDVEVFELDSQYQDVRTRLNQNQNRQRATRQRLANLLNRPDMLPSNLQRPSLDYHKREQPEFEPLLEAALANSPRLKALGLEVAAARKQVEAARASGGPRLNGELEASSYSRELGSSDRWRAGVSLELPLYTGGRVDAAVAEQQTKVYELQARLDEARYGLRQELLDLWLELRNLDLQRQRAYARLDYRELYLDRSRTNYEMEFQADLGDAMVKLSEAQIDLAKNNYDYALVWEQLLAMTGGVTALDAEDGDEEGAEQ